MTFSGQGAEKREPSMSTTLKINYKIFLEAEDVSQTRILSSTAFVKNIVSNHKNPYISCAAFDDENDLDDFVMRFYVEESIEEADCANPTYAKEFIDDIADLISNIAHAHSFLDMEGSFSITYEGETSAYTFASESGDAGCDFEEIEDVTL